jgi:hypothetical protein
MYDFRGAILVALMLTFMAGAVFTLCSVIILRML